MSEKFYLYTVVNTPEEAGEEIICEGEIDGIHFMVLRVRVYFKNTENTIEESLSVLSIDR